MERQDSLRGEMDKLDENSIGESASGSDASSGWNTHQEQMLKAVSERSNCMRWLHNECMLHFESMNFYLTIPNVIISTLNGSFTMSLDSLFPDKDSQKGAQTVIGLISIFSAVLITMNQYVKSQQMMEAHRAATLAYSKMYRNITNELSLRRDQRSNVFEFLKLIRAEQDRLESTAPSILPKVIMKFNKQFAEHQIEKPEIAGDLDATLINTESKERKRESALAKTRRSPIAQQFNKTLQYVNSAANVLFPSQRAEVATADEELFRKKKGAIDVKVYEDEEKKADV